MHQRKKADAKGSSPCFESQISPPALIWLPSLPLPKATPRLRLRASFAWLETGLQRWHDCQPAHTQSRSTTIFDPAERTGRHSEVLEKPVAALYADVHKIRLGMSACQAHTERLSEDLL
jgi:hypothetical protein